MILVFILYSLYVSFAFGEIDPCLSKAENIEAPLCPDSGATILDETYPVQTFVVSTKGHSTGRIDGEADTKMPSDFISTVIQSYPFDSTPVIAVPTTASEFKLLISEVEKKLTQAKYSPEHIKQHLSQIKHIETKSYTWQQDYFESFISPDTGKPEVRLISSYNRKFSSGEATLNGLALLGGGCQIKKGPPVEGELSPGPGGSPRLYSWGGGEMGGNIEGLPGGLCLKGDNQSEKFVSQYCGDKEKGNFVDVEVGWLTVGHVDEVIKVVPIEPKASPEECNFSVWLASPSKGIEVLKSPDFSNRSFIDLTDLSKEEGELKLKDIKESKSGNELCKILESYSLDGKKTDPASKDSQVIQALLRSIYHNLVISNSFASGIKKEDRCIEKLEKITNGEMARLMQGNSEFMQYNQLVQEKMTSNREAIKNKLKDRLPQCKNIDFVDVPDLFFGNGVAEVNGKKELPRHGNARSLFPNPTNSVLANKTMIVPKAPNLAFNKSVEESLNKQGLKTKLVDTWNYAHRGDGNLHCSSHSLPFCRPRGKK